jgi:hypothetical protein
MGGGGLEGGFRAPLLRDRKAIFEEGMMDVLDSLKGESLKFYGVENNVFCVATGSGKRRAFEAVEDPDDGYRSMLRDVREVPVDGRIFFGRPIAMVLIKEVESGFSGWELVDAKDGHVWLRFGTDNADDYYPLFTFEYDPKAG